jgi:hypothetical protein
MKKDDLTQVKNIGPSRMKLLNDSGITTIKELDEVPFEKLVKIKSIGENYARLIKDSVTEYYGKKSERPVARATPKEKKKVEGGDRNFNKQIKALNKAFKKARENLKPLGKKKYLKAYLDFKKRSNSLKSNLKKLSKTEADLSSKVKKKIVKKMDNLNVTLKSAGKKPKKKNFDQLARKIKSFSKMLEDTTS